MRILVISDSHGRPDAVIEAVRRQPQASVVIHLGDGADDLEVAMGLYKEKRYVRLAGNNDYYSLLPYDEEASFDHFNFFCTHGHTHGVKFSTEELELDCLSRGIDVLLYGHTHAAYTGYREGLYIMNPGSVSGRFVSRATYGIVDLTPAGIVCNIVEFKI